MTENGKKILISMNQLQGTLANMWTAREIGDNCRMSSASVAGGMRKLIAEGYVAKGNPGGVITFYKLTEQRLI